MLRVLTVLLLAPVLLVHLTTAPAVPADELPPPADACCDHGAPPPAEESPQDDDCCADDCGACPLRCCGGSVPVVGASVRGLVSGSSATDVLPAAAPNPTGSDPTEIDHPPRI